MLYKGNLGFGWIAQVGLFDITLRGVCIAGHAFRLAGVTLYHHHPPVVTLELPVGFLTKDLFLGLL